MARTRHFLSLSDYTREELYGLMDRASAMKRGIPGRGRARPLEGRCVGMLFEKASTRTRVSFEVGIHQLGGFPVFMNRNEIQIGRGEPIRDTARVLSRYLDALVIRTFGHDILEEFARWSGIPVINGLTDYLHPCQVLGDLMTLREAGFDIATMHAAWVGDGNNMANTWITAAELFGFRLTLACPPGYAPTIAYSSPDVRVCTDPIEAVRGADAISTDVWASMGQEGEIDERRGVFTSYRVCDEVLTHAAPNAAVLHCLPAHRGEEITDEIMERPDSIIWDQAENRLHIQKAILEMLVA
jgi:ornithine carbamoyltransferase